MGGGAGGGGAGVGGGWVGGARWLSQPDYLRYSVACRVRRGGGKDGNCCMAAVRETHLSLLQRGAHVATAVSPLVAAAQEPQVINGGPCPVPWRRQRDSRQRHAAPLKAASSHNSGWRVLLRLIYISLLCGPYLVQAMKRLPMQSHTQFTCWLATQVRLSRVCSAPAFACGGSALQPGSVALRRPECCAALQTLR